MYCHVFFGSQCNYINYFLFDANYAVLTKMLYSFWDIKVWKVGLENISFHPTHECYSSGSIGLHCPRHITPFCGCCVVSRPFLTFPFRSMLHNPYILQRPTDVPQIAPISGGSSHSSNTWFLGPAWVHIPDGTSTGSDVFSGLSIVCIHSQTHLAASVLIVHILCSNGGISMHRSCHKMDPA